MENPTAGASNELRSNRRVSHQQRAMGQTRGSAGALSPAPANRSNDFDELDRRPGQVDGRLPSTLPAYTASRQRSSLQSNPLEAVGWVLQNCQQCVRLARNLYFAYDLARVIHNADARVLDRYVQSRKMVRALMLEAAHADLVSPSV